ncbi:IS1634 family transposase, partial [Candidatus Bipolaricaulota bacterium]|nr:IS1634 family transposase [Candidatus Bipolaricaulota bacterium]
REVTSPRRHGPDVVYLQLAEGYRDSETGKVKTKILHSFGRKDELDLGQVRRLTNQLTSYLKPEDRPDLLSGIEVTHSWDYGGPYVLDALWRELKLDRFFLEALSKRAFERPVERALFALVAQRALAPASKLACTRWAGSKAWIPGLEDGGEGFEPQRFYRAMDFLFAAMPELQRHLYFQVTNLLNADVSVLFYDTTSVSFYLDEADACGEDEDELEGLRRFGHSKKKRPDLPQIVVALAINRDGLPVRHWVFPGNQPDQAKATVGRVTTDLRGLRPRLPVRGTQAGRFLFVGDRGFVSQGNLDYLESRRLPYLLGCRLRSNRVLDETVLSIRGRYRPLREGVGVKETTLTEGGRTIRYLLCHDEARAAHEARVRGQIVATLEAELEGSRMKERHTRKSCKLLSQLGYARYLKELKGGGLRVDRSKVRQEARLDGKTVLMTNDLKLPAEELVQGYHDLWLAERAFRSMKSILEIEPVYHRTKERITSHVHLCVLAYLLTRLVENRSGESWELVRERLNQISLTGLKTERATVLKTKELNAEERSFLKRCGVGPPPRILRIT